MTDFIKTKQFGISLEKKLKESGLKIWLQVIPELKKFGKRISKA